MADGIDGSVLLVCDVVLLAVSDAVTSSGYTRAIGRFVLPVVVWISADQISQSAPLLTPSITASLYFILGVSSWTSITSLILTLCSLFPVTL